MLLAIFGSQAQKYAADINNSFFAAGQEDGAQAGSVGLARQGTLGTAGHSRAPCPPLPGQSKGERPTDPSSPETGGVLTGIAGAGQQGLIQRQPEAEGPCPEQLPAQDLGQPGTLGVL